MKYETTVKMNKCDNIYEPCCCCSGIKLCLILCHPMDLQHVRLPCPSVSPGACPKLMSVELVMYFSKKDQIAINSMILFIIKLTRTAKHVAKPKSDQLTYTQ